MKPTPPRGQKWEHYKAGADDEAISWLVDQSAADKASGGDTNVRQMADPVSAVNINMGTLVGSYERSPVCWTRSRPCQAATAYC